MTPDEKAAFLTSLCDAVRDSAIKAIPQMPEEWDGHELRKLLAELFSREVSSTMRDGRSRRVREYDCARAALGRI